MENKIYRCSINEWRFVKIYTEIHQGSDSSSRKLKEQTKEISTPLKLFSLILVLGIGSSLFYKLPEFPYKNIINSILTILVFVTVIRLFASMIRIGKQRENLIKSLENNTFDTKDIVLYEVTDEGIYINYFNQLDRKDMLYLKWKNIKNVSVDQMIYKSFSYLGERGYERAIYNLKKEFAKAKEDFSDFNYEPKRHYSKIRSVYFTMNNRFVSQLPIPPSWEKNGKATSFLESVEFFCKEKEFEIQ